MASCWQSTTPAALEDCRRDIEMLDVQIGILQREIAVGVDHSARLAENQTKREAAQTRK